MSSPLKRYTLEESAELRCARAMRCCLCTLLIATLLAAVPGCKVWCGVTHIGYKVIGELQDQDGNSLSHILVMVTMENADGREVLYPFLAAEEDGVYSDAGGLFEGSIATFTSTCASRIGALLNPSLLELPPVPLPDPAFIVLRFPDSGREISVQVTADMIASNPDDPLLDDLDLGAVVVPSE